MRVVERVEPRRLRVVILTFSWTRSAGSGSVSSAAGGRRACGSPTSSSGAGRLLSNARTGSWTGPGLSSGSAMGCQVPCPLPT
jgi:hypothetical protein